MATDVLSMKETRTIMIVGNGPIADEAAPVIDASDLVIRFNDCRSLGAGGQKTDVVAVCNTGRPALAMLGGGRWKSNPAVRAAGEIWCTRSADRFAELRPEIERTRPDLDDFCDDYTDGFKVFANMTDREMVCLPAEVHKSADEMLEQSSAEPYVVPSSGLLVIVHILQSIAKPRDRVVLAGFGHAGWDGHPFAAERCLVDEWQARSLVTRIEGFVEEQAQISYLGAAGYGDGR